MNWTEIKKSITEDLLHRGLADPNIRINALERIELLLNKHFPELVRDPVSNFRKIGKAELKARIATFKPTKRLSGAESSIINEIYYRL